MKKSISILYHTSHMRKEACQTKLVEIREKIKNNHDDYNCYNKASLVDKLMDYDRDGNYVQYNRIRLYYK